MKDAGRMLLANVGTYLSVDKVSHFTGLDSSATLLWEHNIWLINKPTNDVLHDVVYRINQEIFIFKMFMVLWYTHNISVALSVPILRNSQMLNALHVDLLYQISTTTDKKCGKCSQKFIYAFN